MATISSGSVQVLTFKQGVLSPLAHDLQLSLRRFELELDDCVVLGRFCLDSLSVDGVVRDGQLRRDILSESQKLEILTNLRQTVLEVVRYPQVVLEGRIKRDIAGYDLDGELEVRGRRRPIRLSAVRRHGRISGQVELIPSLWGVKPFRALLGAIRVQDRVVVRFDLPEPS